MCNESFVPKVEIERDAYQTDLLRFEDDNNLVKGLNLRPVPEEVSVFVPGVSTYQVIRPLFMVGKQDYIEFEFDANNSTWLLNSYSQASFDQLVGGLSKSGVVGDRPNFAGLSTLFAGLMAGYTFYNTTDSVLEVWTGSAWQAV